MTKAFWKSKTILFNTVAALAAVLPLLEQSLPILQGIIGPDYYQFLSAIVVIGNIILRGITNSGIALEDRRVQR